MAGHLQMMFSNVSDALPQAQAGAVRSWMVCGADGWGASLRSSNTRPPW